MAAKIIHPWAPVFDKNSRILILGTMPSPASREFGFYYGHAQNIFWSTLAKVLGQAEPAANIAARREFLLKNHIALWDVLKSCAIDGAKDATIRQPVANDFSEIFTAADIRAVFAAGHAATNLFNKLCAAKAGTEAMYLPSTSPANRFRQNSPAFWKAWRQLRNYLTD